MANNFRSHLCYYYRYLRPIILSIISLMKLSLTHFWYSTRAVFQILTFEYSDTLFVMIHPLSCRVSLFRFYGDTQNPESFMDDFNIVFEILRRTLSALYVARENVGGRSRDHRGSAWFYRAFSCTSFATTRAKYRETFYWFSIFKLLFRSWFFCAIVLTAL